MEVLKSRPVRLLTDHFAWKLLSLVLAALLWVAVVDEPNLTTTINVPVEFRNKPADLEIASDTPERVQLQVRGPRGRVTEAAASRTAVILNLAQKGESARPGEQTFTISDDVIDLPPRVTLERAMPAQLRITLERRLRRDVPVQLRVMGPAPEGWRVKSTEVYPERVAVVGPERRVKQIGTVETDALDLSRLRPEEGRASEVMLNAFVADPHLTLSTPTRLRARVVWERVP
mgnify:CR=1 FL=1